MPVSHHRCDRKEFLEQIRTALNGTLVISGEDVWFMVQNGEDKQIYMVPDMRQFSNLEFADFIIDVKMHMYSRNGRPGQMSFP